MNVYNYIPFENLIYNTESTEIINNITKYVSNYKFKRATDIINGGGYNIVITNNERNISFGVCGS